jgi:hypothetical protein
MQRHRRKHRFVARFVGNWGNTAKANGLRLCATSTPANSGKRTRLPGSVSVIA